MMEVAAPTNSDTRDLAVTGQALIYRCGAPYTPGIRSEPRSLRPDSARP